MICEYAGQTGRQVIGELATRTERVKADMLLQYRYYKKNYTGKVAKADGELGYGLLPLDVPLEKLCLQRGTVV